MPPGFLNGSAQAEQVFYLTVYYVEYDVADV
jgi:hypothetical protein